MNKAGLATSISSLRRFGQQGALDISQSAYKQGHRWYIGLFSCLTLTIIGCSVEGLFIHTTTFLLNKSAFWACSNPVSDPLKSGDCGVCWG